MKKYLVLAAALMASAPAYSAITVDGIRDAAYGVKQSTVTYNPAAPVGNFGAPTPNTNAIGYDIWMTSDASYVYGFLQTFGAGSSAGNFTNLYFDVDPGNGGGSDVVYEITNGLGKILGTPTLLPIPVSVFKDVDTIEWRLPKAYFGADGNIATLRMSQSFGYSVAGGPVFVNGLASVRVGGAVPEPATWGMMLLGFGLLGGAMRQRRKASVAFA